jgi:hypothetical protein
MDLTYGINVETFAGIAVLVTLIIGTAKKYLGEIVKGKEPFLALFLPLAASAVSKLCGSFDDYNWFQVIAFALGMGLTSSLVHDKIDNPILKPAVRFVLGLLKSKAPEDVPLEPVEDKPAPKAVETKKIVKPVVELDENNQPKKK